MISKRRRRRLRGRMHAEYDALVRRGEAYSLGAIRVLEAPPSLIRKTLAELRSSPPTIDRAKIAATTEADIRRHMIEDGEDPDALLEGFRLIMPEATEVFVGSDNIFADLGFPDAEERLAKARVVSGMLAIARRRRLTDAQVGAAVHLDEAAVGELFRGRYNAYSLEQIETMAASLARQRNPPKGAK